MDTQGDNKTYLVDGAPERAKQNNSWVANFSDRVTNGKKQFLRTVDRIDLYVSRVIGRSKPAQISIDVLKKIQGGIIQSTHASHLNHIPEILVKRVGAYLVPAGILAAILVGSIGIGLVAAFGIPLLANPEPLPVMGANPVKPGSIRVISANGVVRATYPGQTGKNLANETELDAIPNMQISTAQGNAKLQLADGTIVYVDDATGLSLASIANPKLNIKNTVLELHAGGILVENPRSVSDVHVRVTPPGSEGATASGQFLGATYLPGQARLDVDCLSGPCQLSGSTSRRDLVSGQHAWMMRGVLAGVDTARWNQWANLCDADCPLLAESGPVVQTTPTLAPTQTVLVPTPSPATRDVTPTPGLIQAASGGADDPPVSSEGVSQPQLEDNPLPTSTPPPTSTPVAPAPTSGGGVTVNAVPPTLVHAGSSGSGGNGNGNSQSTGPKDSKNPPGHQGGEQGGKKDKGNGNSNDHKKPPKNK